MAGEKKEKGWRWVGVLRRESKWSPKKASMVKWTTQGSNWGKQENGTKPQQVKLHSPAPLSMAFPLVFQPPFHHIRLSRNRVLLISIFPYLLLPSSSSSLSSSFYLSLHLRLFSEQCHKQWTAYSARAFPGSVSLCVVLHWAHWGSIEKINRN